MRLETVQRPCLQWHAKCLFSVSSGRRNESFSLSFLKRDTEKAQSMNADAIKSRDEALALLDAELITIHDFMTLCDFKGWDR